MDERAALLLDLAEKEDVAQLFELGFFDDIAEAWCRYSDSSHPNSDDEADWWAIELLISTAFFERPDLYRELLLKLVGHAASDDVLGAIGAGPLENFVSDNEADLVWLEAECAAGPQLRKALSNVWCWGEVSEATMSRLDFAAGSPLPRPHPR